MALAVASCGRTHAIFVGSCCRQCGPSSSSHLRKWLTCTGVEGGHHWMLKPCMASVAMLLRGCAEQALLWSSCRHFLQIQNLQRAHSIFNDVIAQAPSFAEGLNKRATVLYLLRQYEASIEDCERVVSILPMHFGALSGYAGAAVSSTIVRVGRGRQE
eukprot:scaffold1135_cov343-Prasinococcus_capsulatus_cf.AAC.3